MVYLLCCPSSLVATTLLSSPPNNSTLHNIHDMSDSPEQRALFDLEYLESDCTILYDDTTELDNTLSTAVTNYAIGVVGLLAAVGILFFANNKAIDYYTIAFFVLTAAGYSLAGVYHHMVEDTNDASLLRLFYCSIGITVLAIPCLEFTLTTNKLWRVLWALSNLAVILAVVVLEQGFVAAAWSTLSFMGLSVVHVWKRRGYTRSLGCVLIWIGFVILGLFAGTCGGAAQKNCFQNCIFPDPTLFNHNGLFHIFVAVGVSVLGVAEITDEGKACGQNQQQDGAKVDEAMGREFKDEETGQSATNK